MAVVSFKFFVSFSIDIFFIYFQTGLRENHSPGQDRFELS